MRLRVLLVLVVVAVAAGVGLATWRGQVSLPVLRGCSAEVAGHSVGLSTEQAENATLIAALGMQRGLPARAVSIALATAYQESKIVNIDYGDRDSLGLFQQRPSQGWGSEEEVMDPVYSTNAFYEALEQVEGYEDMRITEAAQTVQRSGFPEAYEDHAEDARALASALTGFSPGGAFSCVTGTPGSGADIAAPEALSERLTEAYGDLVTDVEVDGGSDGAAPTLVMSVPDSEAGARLGWSAAAYVVAHAERFDVAGVEHDGRAWRGGSDSRDGWNDAEDAPGTGQVRVSFGSEG